MILGHSLFSGRYLAFGTTWLAETNGQLTEEQRAASEAMRKAFTYRYAREGGDAVQLIVDVERKALAAIEKHGAQRYIEQVARVAGDA